MNIPPIDISNQMSQESFIKKNHPMIISKATDALKQVERRFTDFKMAKTFKYISEKDQISCPILMGTFKATISYSGDKINSLKDFQKSLNMDLAGVYCNLWLKDNSSKLSIPFKIKTVKSDLITVETLDLWNNSKVEVSFLKDSTDEGLRISKIYQEATKHTYGVFRINVILQTLANAILSGKRVRGEDLNEKMEKIITESKEKNDLEIPSVFLDESNEEQSKESLNESI